MAEMARVVINWSGFVGSPGYTNLYFRDFGLDNLIDQSIVDGAVSKTDAWLGAWTPSMPNNVRVAIDPQVAIIESTNGALVRFMNATPPAARLGSGGTNYAAPVGAVVTWYTDVVRNRRRIRGRTFMVPLSTAAYETDGSLATTRLATWNLATSTFTDETTNGDLGIWSRPSLPGATDGEWAIVRGFRIPDMAAVLTSRRD